ncbi:Putative aryl-alcohol dehydrogenase C977.14c [Serendipita indica DSM 11827]|nr:Putative aryl-alcohol dehydrogenase C977.14c [Serendipita indica DSM 11827]
MEKTQMKYVRLGKSGLKISRIILGCMSYGKKSRADWIKEAYRLGINTFDTANIHSLGESERILGKSVKGIGAPRSSFVIFTKVYGNIPPEDAPKEANDNPEEYGYVNYRGLSRKHIFESIKASLERLQMDYVDVLQCHRFDPDAPIEETMRALHDVVQAGYARPRKDRHATYRAKNDKWTYLVQNDEGPNMVIVDRVEEIANKRSITMTQLSLAWLLTKDPVAAPIVGTTNLSHLEDMIKAVNVKLDDEEINYLKEKYTPKAKGKKSWADWVLEEEEGIRQIKEAYRLGINTFDTANVYSLGESERILGKAIKEIGAPRSSFVVLTKVYFCVPPEDAPYDARNDPEDFGYVNYRGLSRKHIFESIKASLERLQMDYVDVLQCHRFDPDTPIEETMRALHDVVQAGYVRYIGMSSCYAWQFHMMQNYAINNNLTPFISMQNYHSLLYRQEEDEMLPTCRLFGVGTIPWSPLSRGVLSRPRKDRNATHRAKNDRWFSTLQKEEDPNMVIVDRVEEIANKRGITMTQDPVAAPIVGTTNLSHLEDMIKAVNVKLDDEEIKYLEEKYAPKAKVGF